MPNAREDDPAVTEAGAKAPIQAAELVRDFGNGRGLFGVSITIDRGTVLSVLGPNGSGKSTLVRCLSLFEPIDSGVISIEGRRWSNEGREESGIDRMRGPVVGAVFQQSEPWPHLSTLRNVLLPLSRAAGLPPSEARARAEEALEVVGLLDRADAMPAELSGGLRQRVCLARALALRPRILLLDEVTSALDPDWSERVRLILRRFADEGGAILNISHQVGFVRRLSDSIAFLEGGKVLEHGPPDIVLGSPRSPRLQRFLQNA